MPRAPRYLEPGSPVVITHRCFQSRFLLRPSKLVNALILGVVALAQQLYGMKIHYLVVMSNHLHLLITPDSLQQLERFQRFVGGNISKEVGKAQGWEGGIFRGRYSMVNVTDEVLAQAGRLKYLLAHGVKEGLVRRPQDWPGIHAVKQLIKGAMRIRGGQWIDRSGLFQATQGYESNPRAKNRRVRKKQPRRIDFTRKLDVVLSPIPCWEHLTSKEYRAAVLGLLHEIANDHGDLIQQVPDDWKKRILSRDPKPRPRKTKRSPRPLCHAATREAWLEFKERFSEYVSAYMSASALLRSGVLAALEHFPKGCHLPRLTGDLRLALERPG
ncbi:MAG: hypothetical protein DWQ36_06430 [Acidobacteria bacterium]|nr:MAG: hypothetical protein DWQ30_19435 [Acidobacteriota bacterium]REK09682.1 MAG: hypothetical protein DWQ36_06430 [Acidobacteriota bacterium]